MKRPNIILLTIDTLRADILRCYGYHQATTPNLDWLAESGIRFTQAITAGSWTQAAFPALLTSSSAAKYGGCLGSLSAKRPSPIEALAARDYATAGFSTNPHLSRATKYDRGFHDFFDLEPVEKDPWLRRFRGGERLLRLPLTHRLSGWLGKSSRPARLYAPAEEVTDKLCHWIDNVEGPFFAWAHYMDVHWPYYLEEELIDPDSIASAWRDLALMHQWASQKRNDGLTNRLQERFVYLYKESLQYLDAQIGRLLTHLDERGHGSNSIIIVVSDHGEEFFEHGRWGHWEDNLHDEIIKVPLIISLPAHPESQVIHQQVGTLDIMPTILELCRCAIPVGVEGVSLLPLWAQARDGRAYGAAELISEMPRDAWHRIAVRTGLFKLIWDSRRPDQPELYNLTSDPGERKNVIENYPLVAEHLKERVEAHLHQVAATQPGGHVERMAVDEAVLGRLRDLGYVD